MEPQATGSKTLGDVAPGAPVTAGGVMTPQQRAQATFDLLVDLSDGPLPIQTPITFWTVGDETRSENGGGCGNKAGINLVLYGMHAGKIVACSLGALAKAFDAAQSDAAALYDYAGRVAWALANGYEAIEETRTSDHMRWIGRRMSNLPHNGLATHTIEAVRGAVPQGDETVMALAALLVEAKPPMPYPRH